MAACIRVWCGPIFQFEVINLSIEVIIFYYDLGCVVQRSSSNWYWLWFAFLVPGLVKNTGGTEGGNE